ncbi:MAG: hydrogenase maturation protease [Bacteroidia bacterium]|nr:hydrogenase maturation protease [Bacteroidia bacterium]
MGKITIMGFGNPVREDDGVGIYVIEKLKEKIEHEDIEILDMGTAAFEVLFKLRGRERIILVDAVINTGEAVGTLYKLPASEINAHIQDDPLVFLHSLKWDQALSYAKKILQEDYPENIDVYLVAIDSTRFNTEMTQEAREGGDKLVDKILEDIDAKVLN